MYLIEDLDEIEPGALWADAKLGFDLGVRHHDAWVRSAIVTNLDWMARATRLTLTSASIDKVTNNLKAIRDDLETIAAEREDLEPEQRDAVDQAAKGFRSELETAAKDVVSGAASGEEAGARIGSALDQLATSFREAYGPVDCG